MNQITEDVYKEQKNNKGCENNLYKIKKIIKISFIIFAVILMSFFNFANSVNASNLDTANIQSVGNCGQLLKYRGIIVETYYAQYNYDGKSYPAYCLDKTKSRSIRYKSLI